MAQPIPPTIAPFENTPIEKLASIAASVRTTYISQKTRPVAWRIQQLRKLYWAIVDNTAELQEACRLDLRKSVFETQSSEIEWTKGDIVFVTKNLEKWVQDE